MAKLVNALDGRGPRHDSAAVVRISVAGRSRAVLKSRTVIHQFSPRSVIASLLALVVTLGCEERSSSPTSPTTASAVSVTAIEPAVGPVIGTTRVQISGTGFQLGATVTVGQAVATNVTVVNSTTITATTSLHAAGIVDVVVTNPGGTSSRLSGGYTYLPDLPLSLTASPTTVSARGQLTVSWTAPSGQSSLDWIGLFKVGDPNTNFEEHWWEYTSGATSGTKTIAAPGRPGQYEFRYLLDDWYTDVIRSMVVTVTG